MKDLPTMMRMRMIRMRMMWLSEKSSGMADPSPAQLSSSQPNTQFLDKHSSWSNTVSEPT